MTYGCLIMFYLRNEWNRMQKKEKKKCWILKFEVNFVTGYLNKIRFSFLYKMKKPS